MDYSKAVELLNLITPKSLKANAELARGMYSRFNKKTPLRYKVAAKVVMEAGR